MQPHNSGKNKRYILHEVKTRIYVVQLCRQVKDIDFVCRRYHISKSLLMRRDRKYDGTMESLTDKSPRPPKRPSEYSHTGRTDMDTELSPSQSKHQYTGIQAHCTACSSASGTAGRQNQQVKNLSITVTMIRRSNWEKAANGCEICAASLLCRGRR